MNNIHIKLASRVISCEKTYQEILSVLNRFNIAEGSYSQGPCLVNGLCDGARDSMILSLLENGILEGDSKEVPVIIVPDEKYAYRMEKILNANQKEALVFPSRDIVFHIFSATSLDFEHERLKVLRKITEKKTCAVICVPDAFLSFLPPASNISESKKLSVGDSIDISSLCLSVTKMGYARSDIVEGKGQFSVRGDIFDIFTPDSDYPVRLEFFGDEIDGAGYFDPVSQRRFESTDEIVLTPAHEIVVEDKTKLKIADIINSRILKMRKKKNMSAVEKLEKELSTLESSSYSCIDKYIPLLSDSRALLSDYAKGGIIIIDYPGVKNRIKSFLFQLNESLLSAANEGEIELNGSDFSADAEEMLRIMSKRPSLIFDNIYTSVDATLSGIFSFTTRHTAPFGANTEVLLEDLNSSIHSGYAAYVFLHNSREAENLQSILNDNKIESSILNSIPDDINTLKKPCVYLVAVNDSSYAHLLGFELPKSKSAIYTFADITSGDAEYKRSKNRAKKAKKSLISLSDISEGDYVVHSVHGIARYEGIQTLTSADVTRDYIKLQYAGKDVLYVPTDQLDKVSKYTGDRENVKVSKMGGSEWQKARVKAKLAAKSIAKNLISLYAERQRLPGYAFSPDTEWQREFEERFEYEETPAQKQSIDEIKKDMEKSCPMDRLLCGDVGFGKTEVALRAAFKCIMDGKQAAVLVPTTILALQHYQTFVSRMNAFPVRIVMLSGLCNAKQKKEALSKIKDGYADIVVGTHSILQRNVEFKDLGLLIVDEEQRFGVTHKERLKEMSKQVDVLTLSATPIPRTFNMALIGIKDMSILDESPVDRFPVQTYVLEYDEVIIAEAIKKELRRSGQVFYLCNNIDKIEAKAEKISSYVPDANVEIAHGRMDKNELSDIWRRLVEGEIDVLVCTTIIETGVDVPNANTLIIEDADRMGLSQLHQIRGRVGRSNRKAYAYFTWHPKGALSEIASKRLSAIREFTEFGSGFKIAMRDLEIRGAGNLLGAEQSGHMDAVGYDLFVKLLEDAVIEEKGLVPAVRKECSVDIKTDAYIPEKYIKRPNDRIEMYKKIADISSVEDAEDISDEIIDRYGKMPKAVNDLIEISLMRYLAAEADIVKIEQSGNNLIVYPKNADRAINLHLYTHFRNRVQMSSGQRFFYTFKNTQNTSALEFCKQIINIFTEFYHENNKEI